MAHVGIDIGTYTTLVSYISDGQPAILQVDGHFDIPSVIAVDERGGSRQVGRGALDAWAAPEGDDGQVFRRWKLAMGDGSVLTEMRFGGERGDATAVTPELLTTWLVEYAVGQLATGLGGVTVESVLVTVPHGWRRDNPEKCRSTRQAAGAATVGGQALAIQPRTVSEPVAAAIYWLWAAKRAGRSDFAGQTILVCDVGGGTFDLSLVRVAEAPGEPHLVVDAINSNDAGDYATALILAQVLRQANEDAGTSFPVDAQDVLERVVGGDQPALRALFSETEQFKCKMSIRINQARAKGREAVALRQTFSVATPGGAEHDVRLSMTQQQFFDCLEPFFRHGRDLVSRFLQRSGPEAVPWAVVYAGGGSRLAGIGDRCLRPVLDGLVPDPDEVLTRIPLNDGVIDRAVALGAALIASGIEQVEERLLYDIGLEFTVDAERIPTWMAEAVQRETGQDLRENPSLFISPLAARGQPLPTECDVLSVLGSDLRLGDDEFRLLLDDDPEDPLIEEWEPPPLPHGGRRLGRLHLHVDGEGVVTLAFDVDGGGTHRHSTPLRRTAKSRGTGRSAVIVALPKERSEQQIVRISPAAWQRVVAAGKDVQR